MKTETVYRAVRYLGIGLIFASLIWSFYRGVGEKKLSGGPSFSRAVGLYTDGNYEEALGQYEASIREYPDFIHAQRGRARTLMQLGHDREALEAFNEVLIRDPESAVSFANRGILHDRMGFYPEAIADYDRAIRMEPKLGEGLDWFTRLLQNRKEKPQTLLERLQTLRASQRANQKIMP
ncbi:MAG: tetratricopeptide repeat protein [Nitrospinaceae bacterium]|jgi:tetratricopeptide (TPR) repeat protein|nr:tetratricopeptide repeat protein [Nitrospina sp.]MBT5377141.1 tetratricopeptide repeat protein [Nitrospinaceae bacterium]MBT5868536.1 tetratricopeptide repeat protein [Nitrospinaceae bacterium]MBT6346840.1 tetratricopeptide repeat protein [Nitrospina sp.]